MKYKLLQFIIMTLKYSSYAFVLQTIFMVQLLANESVAQYQSVKKAEIRVKFVDSTISEVFEAIEEKTGYKFYYKKSDLKNGIKVDLKNSNYPVSDILLKVSEQAGLKFRQVNNSIAVTRMEKDNREQDQRVQVILEDIIVQGKVTDEKGEPLPGASVIVKHTGEGTVTDIDGNYKLTTSEDATLVVSSVGYGLAELAVNGRSTIDIQLFEDLKTLQEVVVVGYGTTLKEDLTGTVSSIESEKLLEVPSPTIDQSLVGKMSGVHVSAVSGKPGEGSIVNIRGMSQVRGDNQPLYVVDGVPVVVNPQYGDQEVGQGVSRENPLLMINPNDVERVDVLKDASAAAIYGSRAANGVILITTKRGKAGQEPSLTLSVSATIQNPINEYDYLNASEWKEFSTALAIAQLGTDTPDPIFQSRFQPAFNMLTNPDFYGEDNTDWQDLITNENALWMQYGLNYSGAKDNFRYSTAINITDMDGVLLGNEFDRYGFRMNLDGDLGKLVSIGNSFSYNYSINKASAVNALNLARFRPDLGVFDEDGEYTGNPHVRNPGLTLLNPLGDQAFVDSESISQNLFMNVYGEVNIIDDLSFRSDISLSVATDLSNTFNPSFTSVPVNNVAFRQPEGAILENINNMTRTSVFTNRLIYNTTFNDHHILNANIGIEWNSFYTELNQTDYRGFPDDVAFTNINSANEVADWANTSQENGLNSIFARINYGYSEKYLATFTIRRDGSNKFGPNNQYGVFPSGAIAWNAHNEDFLSSVEMISTLKWRASYGRTGSDNLPPFGYLSYMGAGIRGTSIYGPENEVGLVFLGIPNPDIKWETTDQLDVGLEFGLFENRLNAEVVYFQKKTSDLILFQPITFESGARQVNANVADVTNKGWEITIGADVIRSSDLRWNSSINLTFIDNNIDALNGGTEFSTGTNASIREGYSLGSIIGFEIASIAQTQEEIDDLNNAAPDGNYYSSLIAPGDYIFRDVDGDGEITTNDQTVLGDINPNFYGGWNNSVSFKNFELTFNFQFSQGNEKRWTDVGSSFLSTASYDNALPIVNDTWEESRTDATYARIGSATHGGDGTIVHANQVFDASYIRLRTVGLAYTLPANKVFKSVRIYANANNLWTSSDYPGLDPESTSPTRGGISSDRVRDGGNYPLTKSFTFGLNLGF